MTDYEEAFEDGVNEGALCRRSGDRVALRFLDPLNRKDRAGRVIPHEFVLDGGLAAKVTSVEQGLHFVWPLVSDEFEQIWQLDMPPSAHE